MFVCTNKCGAIYHSIYGILLKKKTNKQTNKQNKTNQKRREKKRLDPKSFFGEIFDAKIIKNQQH